MVRSGWKLPFVHSIFLSKLFLKSKQFSTPLRNCTVMPNFVGKKILVHSGSSMKSVIITKPMIGKKLGEFSITKVFGSLIALSMALKQRRKKEDKKRKKK